MSKLEIAISTLLLGFILGQAVDFIKYKWAIIRKQKALDSEIDDIVSEFSERMSRIQQIIRSISDSHIAVPVPGTINTVIYDSSYPDIAAFYGRNERKSINHIYSHTKNYNLEVNNGDRSNLKLAKKSLFLLYSQSKYGYETALNFRASQGKHLLMEDIAKINEINNDIQKFAKLCEIASYVNGYGPT